MLNPERYKTPHPVPELINPESMGYYEIPHYQDQGFCFYVLTVVANGWEQTVVTVRVKASRSTRCPTWEEMCFIKNLFWHPEDCVMQLHPPASDYVNNHPYALHLWKPINQTIPRPPSSMVGIKSPR